MEEEYRLENGESGRDAIQFYARQRNDRCSVHFEEVTRGVLRQGEEVMCFVDLEKAFDRVPSKVLEWAIRKRCIPEAMVRAVMSLYEDAETRVRVGLELSKEFEVKVGVHQGFVLSALVFASVVDVVMESVRNGLRSETMEGLREKFWKWKEAFKSKGLKVNLGKTKVVVSEAEGEVSVS